MGRGGRVPGQDRRRAAQDRAEAAEQELCGRAGVDQEHEGGDVQGGGAESGRDGGVARPAAGAGGAGRGAQAGRLRGQDPRDRGQGGLTHSDLMRIVTFVCLFGNRVFSILASFSIFELIYPYLTKAGF